jgi:hypothetical protein
MNRQQLSGSLAGTLFHPPDAIYGFAGAAFVAPP